MDQGSSSLQTTRPSRTVEPLNDSVYELHKPLGTTKVQVIFFHGFQLEDDSNAYLSTWKCGNGDSFWPQTWLPDEFPDAHILSISYNASLTKRSTEHEILDLFLIAENLMSDLLLAKIGQERDCPVILVGHSFGGLVIKQLCLHAKKKGEDQHTKFLENLKGLFFYSTPHNGIPPEESLALFANKSPFLVYVRTLSAHTARLNQDFEDLIYNKCEVWSIAAVGENLPTKWPMKPFGLFSQNLLLVPEGSSRYGSDFVIVQDANHFTICQPVKKTSTSFVKLKKLVNDIYAKLDEDPENRQRLPELVVGLDTVIEELKTKLHQDTTRSLGLLGMGGIGKTTLAKALFNKLLRSYEYSCFIDDVQNRQGAVTDIMLENLHHRGRQMIHSGRKLGFLKRKRLLLVVDNATSYEKHLDIIKALQNDVGVHKDSRFIATSRDFEVLKFLNHVHSMTFLSDGDADQLFRAFALQKEVRPSFEIYVPVLVSKCEGLPLTLQVIGSYLYKQTDSIWNQAIKALEKAEAVGGFEERLWAKLKVSYDGLDEFEKNMFCDAATVFYYRHLNLVTAKAAWSVTIDYEEMRWKHLVDLSLAWEPEPGYYRMHEQILTLGGRIASNPENGRQVCYDRAKAVELLTAEDCTEDDVKGIVALKLNDSDALLKHIIKEILDPLLGAVQELHVGETNGAMKSMEALIGVPLERLTSLMTEFVPVVAKLVIPAAVKMFEVNETVGVAAEALSISDIAELLGMEGLEGSSASQCPPSIEGTSTSAATESDGRATQTTTVASSSTTAQNFIELLQGQYENEDSALETSMEALQLDNGDFPFGTVQDVLKELTMLFRNPVEKFEGILPASGNLFELVTTFADVIFPNLQSFVASTDEDAVRAAITPFLPFLAKLNLKPEILLKEVLPLVRAFSQNSDEEWASTWLKIQGHFLSDRHLNIRGSTLSKMRKLLYLDLANISIEEFHGRTFPSTLVCLWLENMNFTNFVLDTSYYKRLAVLSLQNCSRLTGCSLPTTFGQLSALRVLLISKVGLSSLPDSFGNLSKLTHLSIAYCVALKELPETFGKLVALEDLSLVSCPALSVLPDSFRGLSRLTRLTIEDCPCLHQLPNTFLQLQQLAHLKLLCISLQSLPKLENLRSLSTLTVDWCTTASFPSLPESFGKVITTENYTKRQFTFGIVGGQFELRKLRELGIVELMMRSSRVLTYI